MAGGILWRAKSIIMSSADNITSSITGAPPHSNISIFSRLRPRWRGFSFALHLDPVQGFYFAQMQYSPIQTFTARFAVSMQLYRPRNKTAHRALQRLFQRLHPLNRPRYQIPPPYMDTAQVSTAAYYNKVYKTVQGCALLWIHVKRRSI